MHTAIVLSRNAFPGLALKNPKHAVWQVQRGTGESRVGCRVALNAIKNSPEHPKLGSGGKAEIWGSEEESCIFSADQEIKDKQSFLGYEVNLLLCWMSKTEKQ